MQSTYFPVQARPLVHTASGNDLRINYALLGVILVIDQLLLPMFRVGSISFKVSYFICGIWLIHWLMQSRHRRDVRRDVGSVFTIFALIIVCVVMGELWLAAMYPVDAYYETVRGIMTYTLVALAFGLGRSTRNFKLEWLIPVLFAALALNFLFIVFRNELPAWLINFYYPERALAGWDRFGITSVEGILELARPRGLFGNPNASMLLVNVIVVFIHLALRNRLLEIRSLWIGVVLVGLPLILAVTLGSRGEFVVASVLAWLNFRLLVRNQGNILRRSFIAVLFGVIGVLVGLGVARLAQEIPVLQNWDRIAVIASTLMGVESDQNEASVSRRLSTGLEVALVRFSDSPLFGAGISAADAPFFEAGTQYLHNDWLMLLATSGVVGFAAMVWLLWRFVWPLGWPALIPFVLPGMVNTFMLNIPAFIFYFFMIGVLRAQLRGKAAWER